MRKSITALAVGTALGATLVSAPSASAATITTKGTGWQLETQTGVTSASPTATYTITYQSDAVKRFYAPQIQRAVGQINSTTSLHLAIGGVEAMDPNKCGPDFHIQVLEMHNPMGDAHPGWSQGMACPNPVKGMSKGGIVAMNDTFRSGEWNMTPETLQNTSVHEMLHAVGLDHPNAKALDGSDDPYNCVATSYGNKPIMCSPSGGYKTWNNVGKLLAYDINGINALINNAKAQGLS